MCALIKTGGGIAEIRGSIGGTTFSRGRYGAIARNRSVPVQPNTERQLFIRQTFGYVMDQWFTLDAASKDGWNVYAAAVAMTNRLGETMYLSGQNHFVRTNTARIIAGLTIVTTAPAALNLGTSDPAAAINSVGVSVAGGTLEVNLTITEGLAPYIGATNGMALYASQPVNPGVSYYGGNMLFLQYVPGIVAPGLQTPLEKIVTAPTGNWQEGQQIWVGLRWFLEDGRVTQLRKIGPVTLGSYVP